MRTMRTVVRVVTIAVGIPATAIRRIAVIIRAAEKEIEAEIDSGPVRAVIVLAKITVIRIVASVVAVVAAAAVADVRHRVERASRQVCWRDVSGDVALSGDHELVVEASGEPAVGRGVLPRNSGSRRSRAERDAVLPPTHGAHGVFNPPHEVGVMPAVAALKLSAVAVDACGDLERN
mgnify:CR=1 FL=1